MQLLKDKSIKDFIQIQLIFAVLAAVTLLFPFPGVFVDQKMLIIVVLYNALIVVEIYHKGHEEWKSIWLFSFILSLLMIFPDWYLAETLGALQFPAGGLPMIGNSIPLYMAGLWSIPFFIILFVGKEVQQRTSIEITYGVVAILGVLIFVLSELTLVNLPSWEATVTGMIGNLAYYIIIPELFLSLSTFICFEFVREKKIWMKVLGAFSVVIFYIGSASFFFFLIETLLL